MGEPVGFIRPFGATEDRVVQQAQHAALRAFITHWPLPAESLLSKLLFIEQFEQE